jgi:hypothetical protein
VLEQTQDIAQVGDREVDPRTGPGHWTAETYRIHETTAAHFQPTAGNAVRFDAPESRALITRAAEKASCGAHATSSNPRGRRPAITVSKSIPPAAPNTSTAAPSGSTERSAMSRTRRRRKRNAGGIAPDFNHRLTVIFANATFALAEGRAKGNERLDHIESAARRADDLCRQMLAYAGQGSFVIENVDATNLCRTPPASSTSLSAKRPGSS